jgi:hypothetical protein
MRYTSQRHRAAACALSGLLCAASAVVSAQAPSSPAPGVEAQTSQGPRPGVPRPAPRPVPPRKWRLTFRAGGALVNQPTTGLSALPPAGLPENLGANRSTRIEPTWFFGDGAALLNTVLTQRGLATPFVPIDSTLTSAGIARPSGAAFGVSISKDVGRRYRLEVSLDGTQSAPAFTTAALAALEASRGSFTSTWNALLSEAFVQNTAVSATNTVAPGSSLEWLTTGVVHVNLRARPHSTWYATLGGGFVADTGTGPSATLVGHIAFQTPFQLTTGPIAVPFSQTDTVVVTAVRPKRGLGLLGGGWSHDLTKRVGISADVRLALSGNGVKTLVNATPTETQTNTTPIVFLVNVSPGSPTVFFSSKSSAIASSLTGAPVASFGTFTGGGLQVRAQLTAGFFYRF